MDSSQKYLEIFMKYLAKIKVPTFLIKIPENAFQYIHKLTIYCDLRDIGGQHARQIATSVLSIWELSQQDF